MLQQSITDFKSEYFVPNLFYNLLRRNLLELLWIVYLLNFFLNELHVKSTMGLLSTIALKKMHRSLVFANLQNSLHKSLVSSLKKSFET